MAMLNNQRVWVITMVIMGNNLHSFEDYPSIINWLTNNHSWLPYSAMVITSIVSRFPIFSLGVATLYPHDENIHLMFFFFLNHIFHCPKFRSSPRCLLPIIFQEIPLSGWWFQTFFIFISYMGCHPSHWRTPSFFQMVGQPPTRWLIVMVDIIVVKKYINHILTIY